MEKAREAREKLEKMQNLRYNHNSRDCKTFKEGANIWVQIPETKKWDDGATVIDRTRNQSYKIMMGYGETTNRNRRLIWTRIQTKQAKELQKNDNEAARNNGDDVKQDSSQKDDSDDTDANKYCPRYRGDKSTRMKHKDHPSSEKKTKDLKQKKDSNF